MKKTTLLYSLFLTAVIAVFAVLLWRGNWLQTDLKALLPEEQSWSAAQIKADEIQEQALNRQLVLLVGAAEQSHSFQMAEELAARLRASGLFSQIMAKNLPNLTALQAEIKQLKWAVLPERVRKTLTENPQRYFQQLAESFANPFAERNLLPVEQDWLGFGRFTLESSQSLSSLQWDAQRGAVFTQADGKTWTLLRAELADGHLLDTQADVLTVIKQAKQFAQAHQSELLAAGSVIFSAMAKQAAEKESALMSGIGIGLTLTLLLLVFRTAKVLWLFLPIGLGLIAGVTATVLWFGHIHILTLVVGSSLIGVLIDFPLHWLTGAKFSPTWHARRAMEKLKSTFLISLLITLLGYTLLAFTSLPILKQTALFSAAALVTAIGATVCYLPYLIPKLRVSPTAAPPRTVFSPRLFSPLLLILLLVSLLGIPRSQWRDDIRQWVALPEAELTEAARLAKLTGIDLGTQYFLLTADNAERLLELDRSLCEKLTERGISHQALSQWILSETQQKQTALQIFDKIRPLDLAALYDLGIPADVLQQALDELRTQPAVSLAQALESQIGAGWKTLYLGDLGGGKLGGIVKVNQLTGNENLAALADNRQIFWQDKRVHLNQAFQAARNQAAWLKAASFGLALLLLWRFFGIYRSGKMLLIPLVAILMTVGVFGWLGRSITLFAMFGLLLVSAIGIDYTAYMEIADEPWRNKRYAVFLAAMTTMISFTLLAFSGTPAVAGFGTSVATGVLFSLLLTLFYSKILEKKDANSV